MTAATHDPTTRTTARKLAGFIGHYVEMVVAMIIGMVALAPLWPAAWQQLPEVDALIMATDMTVAMVAWMKIRGHSWRPIAEMSAAMYLPFALALVPYWAGLLSAHGLMMAGHIAMFPLMLAAMVWRRDEYWH